MVNERNEIQEAIISLLLKGNKWKCYCGLQIDLTSRSVTRKTNIWIIKIILRIILMYGDETWASTQSDECNKKRQDALITFNLFR
jgi:hypothetical protein